MKRFVALALSGAAALALGACGDEKPKEAPPAELGPDTAAAGPALVIGYDEAQGDFGRAGFYADAPAADEVVKPGAFLRSEQLPAHLSLAGASRADRFVYVSTDGPRATRLLHPIIRVWVRLAGIPILRRGRQPTPFSTAFAS